MRTMKMRTNASLVGLGLLGAVMGSAPAAALPTIDGNLSDWGVTIADYAGDPSGCGNNPALCVGSNYSGFPGFKATQEGLGYGVGNNDPTADDKNDVSNNYVHIPATSGNPATGGGQNYDVEFMAAVTGGGKLHMAIASGQRSDNGSQFFSPGDIKVTVGGNVYAIEVGGGLGGNNATTGTTVVQGNAGTTYNLDSAGHVTSLAATNGAQVAGSIWKAGAGQGNWIVDPIGTDQDDVQYAMDDLADLVGFADFVFTVNDQNDEHSTIELRLDLSLIGANVGETILVEWGPSCANDFVEVAVLTSSGDIEVPAPAALPLFLFGIAGLAALRRRSGKAA